MRTGNACEFVYIIKTMNNTYEWPAVEYGYRRYYSRKEIVDAEDVWNPEKNRWEPISLTSRLCFFPESVGPRFYRVKLKFDEWITRLDDGQWHTPPPDESPTIAMPNPRYTSVWPGENTHTPEYSPYGLRAASDAKDAKGEFKYAAWCLAPYPLYSEWQKSDFNKWAKKQEMHPIEFEAAKLAWNAALASVKCSTSPAS